MVNRRSLLHGATITVQTAFQAVVQGHKVLIESALLVWCSCFLKKGERLGYFDKEHYAGALDVANVNGRSDGLSMLVHHCLRFQMTSISVHAYLRTLICRLAF